MTSSASQTAPVQLTPAQELAETKRLIALRYRLLGMGSMDPKWYTALEAFEFSKEKHAGQTRKGGGQYISHPVAATNYVLTLASGLILPMETVAVTILHDVGEDCDVRYQEFQALFGSIIADGVAAISKVFEGVKKTEAEYARDVAGSVTASIGKPADRTHNMSTMGGAFTVEKQLRYCTEAEDLILGRMVKPARRRFVRQESAYENCKLVLESQIALVRAIHAKP